MPDPATIRIGTRGSRLTTTQTGHTRDVLIELGQPAELAIVKTAGDYNRHDPTEEIGTGIFTQALRHTLHEGMYGIIVHSFKDLPTVPEDDMMVTAMPEHVDPRETLISRDTTPLMNLSEDVRVGISVSCHVPQLCVLHSDPKLVPLCGNIETHMGRVSEDLDAIILACVGSERADCLGEIAESLNVDALVPASAQGTLVLEYHIADHGIVDILYKTDHPVSHTRAVVERAVLNKLEAGCTAPVAAYVIVSNNSELILQAKVFTLDGSYQLLEIAAASVNKVGELGRKVAVALLERGTYKVIGGILRGSQK